MRSNAGTCMNQKPLVKKGQRVSKGQVICDGPAPIRVNSPSAATWLVAFMPWNGYNFEDAILISEKIVKEDIILPFTSRIRDQCSHTNWTEEITRDIPNVAMKPCAISAQMVLVRIGAEVKPAISRRQDQRRRAKRTGPEERLLPPSLAKRRQT